MVAPQNYAQYIAQVKNPFESALGGFAGGMQLGAGVRNMQLEQQAAEQKMLMQQAAFEQQQALQNAMGALSQKIASEKVRPEDVFQVAMIAPKEQAETLIKTFESFDERKKKETLQFSGQVLAALGSKNPQVGVELIKQKAEALRNRGNMEEAESYEQWANLASENKEGAQAVISSLISPLPGGDKVIESWLKTKEDQRKAELQPLEVSKLQSEAKKASVAAKFAESDAALELEKKGWDITKIQEDIKIAKQNTAIAALNAQINKESNQLKKDELLLKRDEMKRKRDDEVRAKAADAEGARSTIDNLLNTADRILATPKNVIGSAAGPISSKMLTVSQDTADFEELVNTMSSQTFLSQVSAMKGLGALSEKEGDKLQAALQNLSLRQSPERLVENVKEAQRLMLKARGQLAKRYGIPDTIPDTPAVQASGDEIDALVKKYTQGP